MGHRARGRPAHRLVLHVREQRRRSRGAGRLGGVRRPAPGLGVQPRLVRGHAPGVVQRGVAVSDGRPRRPYDDDDRRNGVRGPADADPDPQPGGEEPAVGLARRGLRAAVQRDVGPGDVRARHDDRARRGGGRVLLAAPMAAQTLGEGRGGRPAGRPVHHGLTGLRAVRRPGRGGAVPPEAAAGRVGAGARARRGGGRVVLPLPLLRHPADDRRLGEPAAAVRPAVPVPGAEEVGHRPADGGRLQRLGRGGVGGQLADRLEHLAAADAVRGCDADRGAAVHGAEVAQVVRDRGGVPRLRRLDRLQVGGRHGPHDPGRVLGARAGPAGQPAPEGRRRAGPRRGGPGALAPRGLRARAVRQPGARLEPAGRHGAQPALLRRHAELGELPRVAPAVGRALRGAAPGQPGRRRRRARAGAAAARDAVSDADLGRRQLAAVPGDRPDAAGRAERGGGPGRAGRDDSGGARGRADPDPDPLLALAQRGRRPRQEPEGPAGGPLGAGHGEEVPQRQRLSDGDARGRQRRQVDHADRPARGHVPPGGPVPAAARHAVPRRPEVTRAAGAIADTARATPATTRPARAGRGPGSSPWRSRRRVRGGWGGPPVRRARPAAGRSRRAGRRGGRR
ncbi:hypothetical protein SGPA1_50799 [Streptomyces misionensis JCM 4497]